MPGLARFAKKPPSLTARDTAEGGGAVEGNAPPKSSVQESEHAAASSTHVSFAEGTKPATFLASPQPNTFFEGFGFPEEAETNNDGFMTGFNLPSETGFGGASTDFSAPSSFHCEPPVKNDATKPRGIGGIALFRGKKPQEGDNNPGTLSSSAVNQSTSVEMGESVTSEGLSLPQALGAASLSNLTSPPSLSKGSETQTATNFRVDQASSQESQSTGTLPHINEKSARTSEVDTSFFGASKVQTEASIVHEEQPSDRTNFMHHQSELHVATSEPKSTVETTKSQLANPSSSIAPSGTSSSHHPSTNTAHFSAAAASQNRHGMVVPQVSKTPPRGPHQGLVAPQVSKTPPQGGLNPPPVQAPFFQRKVTGIERQTQRLVRPGPETSESLPRGITSHPQSRPGAIMESRRQTTTPSVPMGTGIFKSRTVSGPTQAGKQIPGKGPPRVLANLSNGLRASTHQGNATRIPSILGNRKSQNLEQRPAGKSMAPIATLKQAPTRALNRPTEQFEADRTQQAPRSTSMESHRIAQPKTPAGQSRAQMQSNITMAPKTPATQPQQEQNRAGLRMVTPGTTNTPKSNHQNGIEKFNLSNISTDSPLHHTGTDDLVGGQGPDNAIAAHSAKFDDQQQLHLQLQREFGDLMEVFNEKSLGAQVKLQERHAEMLCLLDDMTDVQTELDNVEDMVMEAMEAVRRVLPIKEFEEQQSSNSQEIPKSNESMGLQK